MSLGRRRLLVLTTHLAKDGSPKVVAECTLPLTGRRVVDRIITDRADFAVDDFGLVLTALAPGVELEELERMTAAPFRVALSTADEKEFSS